MLRPDIARLCEQTRLCGPDEGWSRRSGAWHTARHTAHCTAQHTAHSTLHGTRHTADRHEQLGRTDTHLYYTVVHWAPPQLDFLWRWDRQTPYKLQRRLFHFDAPVALFSSDLYLYLCLFYVHLWHSSLVTCTCACTCTCGPLLW